ncbi:Hypothetical predicted protein, partial [Xyrichtys novacula]
MHWAAILDYDIVVKSGKVRIATFRSQKSDFRGAFQMNLLTQSLEIPTFKYNWNNLFPVLLVGLLAHMK